MKTLEQMNMNDFSQDDGSEVDSSTLGDESKEGLNHLFHVSRRIENGYDEPKYFWFHVRTVGETIEREVSNDLHREHKIVSINTGGFAVAFRTIQHMTDGGDYWHNVFFFPDLEDLEGAKEALDAAGYEFADHYVD